MDPVGLIFRDRDEAIRAGEGESMQLPILGRSSIAAGEVGLDYSSSRGGCSHSLWMVDGWWFV